jgi:hypothetical protein
MAWMLIRRLSLFVSFVGCHAAASVVGVLFGYTLYMSVGDRPAYMVLWFFFFPRLLLYRMGVQFNLEDHEAVVDALVKPPTLATNSFAWVACLYAVWFAWRYARRSLRRQLT